MRVNSLADAAAFLNLLLVANWGPPRNMLKCKPKEETMNIGERLKMARRMAGLSLRDLAAQADVSAMAISKYENARICRALPF